MNIRDWPLNKIMQLPDWCFGRRWPIGLGTTIADGNPVFVISSAALPEKCVIWDVVYFGTSSTLVSTEIGLALGDVLPTTQAEYAVLEPLFPGCFSRVSGQGNIEVPSLVVSMGRRLRFSVHSAGRRLVARFIRLQGVAVSGQVVVIVSSIPSEVPDWLVSGYLRSP